MMIPFVLLLFTQFDLDPTALYNLGNERFEQGKHSEAITAYEQASQKLSNAKLFYNLGNAYFKKGRHGKAILNYRRAQFIAPRDADIRNNLMFVRNYRVDKISSEDSPIVKLLSGIFRTFSHLEAQLLTTALFVLFALFIALYIVYRRNVFGYTAIMIVSLCLFFFISWQVWAAELNGHHAVVIAPEVSAMSGPGEDYKKIIVLHDGAEVKVRERRGDYFLIQLPRGIGGWLPVDAVEDITGR